MVFKSEFQHLVSTPVLALSSPSLDICPFQGGLMPKQIIFNLKMNGWGGRRLNAGRSRIRSKGVAHKTRPLVSSKTALHINFKLKVSIRNKECLKLLKRAITNARNHGLAIIHYSLQSNHVHLIVESRTNEIMTRGMRSLTITFAKGLKRGRVQIERYHLHVLRSLRETRNAVMYVLFNQQKHSGLKRAYVDSYSSLGWLYDLKKLAQFKKFTISLNKIPAFDFLDRPRGWMLRHVGLGDSS